MVRSLRQLLTLFALAAFSLPAFAQEFQPEIQAYLRTAKSKWKLSDTDINNWAVSDQYTQPRTGITYTYLHQEVAGIRIFNAVSAMAIRNGQVAHFANRFHADAAAKANTTQPTLQPEAAILAAAAHLGLSVSETPKLLKTDADRHIFTFSDCGIAHREIEVELLFVPVGNTLRLAWNVNMDLRSSPDWWNLRMDAVTGQYLEKNNWTLHCDFGDSHAHSASCRSIGKSHNAPALPAASSATATNLNSGTYNVYALPVEGPSFGGRSVLEQPHSAVGSPLGWHQVPLEEGDTIYTITRGNNVYAYEDRNASNQPGYSPDGGPELNFDFPIDLALAPLDNQDAIITNLFYVNNMLHDILYVHGFDERAGNFQAHNFDLGGRDGDFVRAEAQDGGGTNNANFSTPADGNNGRMQMFLWPSGAANTMVVSTPEDIAGTYPIIPAGFGPGFGTPVTGQLVLIEDDTEPFSDGCNPILNAADLAGKIVVIDRGNCTFIAKVNAAEAEGAIAVIIINNVAGAPTVMGGTGSSSIPAGMISLANGELLKAQLAAGETVEATLSAPSGEAAQARDGSLDNGIIAHEYGHGLSIRLTGGPSNSNCLSNAEQGGEGWSDWLGLILTIEPGDVATDTRGIGTYATNDNTGRGIRRFPYSFDQNINPHTYGSLATSNGVHAIGEIWAQVAWDLTWKLIEAEGFDPDWYEGTGGNNTAMRLIIEGMKLQPCGPGYLDARDAILAADALLYDNAHRCIIWEAFAGRGMGKSAIQGSAGTTGDEVQNFLLPNICLTPVQAPIANFAADVTANCYGRFSFTDLSEEIPQAWFWDFGDGNTSEEESPAHAYDVPGVYTVSLTVTNTLGTDTYTLEVEYTIDAAPAVSGFTAVCEGSTTTLSAAVEPGKTAVWSANGEVVFTGPTFQTPALTAPVTYTVLQLDDKPVQNVGPADNSFGTGGNHNTGFDGQVLFEAFEPLRILSVLVYAQGEGDRTIRLLDEAGNDLQTATVFVPDGANRVTLNFDVPAAGKYSLANFSENLYRNNAGASYPYLIDDLLSIYSSNATGTTLSFYYYFYDWEVQEAACLSETAEVTLEVTPGPLAGFSSEAENLSVQFTDASVNDPTSGLGISATARPFPTSRTRSTPTPKTANTK
jgi:PKD repeat protein